MSKRKGFKVSDLFGPRVSKNFTWAELTKTGTGLPNDPPEEARISLKLLVDNVLQPLREKIGVPIIINSAYRSPGVNKAIGGASTSQHQKGEAADFKVVGKDLKEVFDLIVKENIVPYDQIIYETKPGTEWIHISYKDRNRHQALLAQWDTAKKKMVYSNIG